jgi:hypothetical protein
MKKPSECEHEWVFEALEAGFKRYRCSQCREQKFEKRESLKQRDQRLGYQESQEEGCRCGQCECDPCECE